MTDTTDYPDLISAFLNDTIDWNTDTDVDDLDIVIDDLFDQIDEMNRNIGWLKAIRDKKMKLDMEKLQDGVSDS